MDAGTLATLKVFEGLPDDELTELAGGFKEVSLPAGEVLARAGDYGYHFFGILDGVVGVTVDGAHAAVLEAGDTFGEISLVSEEGRRTATAVATSDVRLASLMAWDFRELESRCPAAWERIQQARVERAG